MSFPPSLQNISEQSNQLTSDYFYQHIAKQEYIEPKLKQAIEYALLNGGKRMRPMLVFLTGDILDISQEELTPLALAIECVHAYSLVHDDLPAMDDDDLRRGNPTCHIKFDEATAILAGDALQTLAFEVIADASFRHQSNDTHAKLIMALCKAAGAQGMVGGQSLDLISTNKVIDLVTLRQLHKMKTGAMINVSVAMPCILSQTIRKQDTQALLTFADCIGMAFQIQDDILDVIADTETLGKPQGSDENANKSTFVSLLGLQGAQEELAKQHQLAVHALQTLPYNTNKLKDFADFMLTRTY